jgi:hypothetical protein
MPTKKSIKEKPKHTPQSNGMLLRMPKFKPDDMAIIVFGPGVTDADIEKMITENKYSIKAPVRRNVT